MLTRGCHQYGDAPVVCSCPGWSGFALMPRAWPKTELQTDAGDPFVTCSTVVAFADVNPGFGSPIYPGATVSGRATAAGGEITLRSPASFLAGDLEVECLPVSISADIWFLFPRGTTKCRRLRVSCSGCSNEGGLKEQAVLKMLNSKLNVGGGLMVPEVSEDHLVAGAECGLRILSTGFCAGSDSLAGRSFTRGAWNEWCMTEPEGAQMSSYSRDDFVNEIDIRQDWYLSRVSIEAWIHSRGIAATATFKLKME